MKKHLFLMAILAGNTAWSAAFTNLDFESVIQPVPPPDPLGFPSDTVPAAAVLPGWQVLLGDVETPRAFYNDYPLSLASVTVFSRSFNPFGLVEGEYRVFLKSGLIAPLPTGASAGISQTGLVPADSRSIQMKVFNSTFDVSLGEEAISMVPVFSGPNYVLYAGDITSHAGLEQRLKISVPYDGIAPLGQGHAAYFDSIIFSPDPIPEPNTFFLLALGGALCAVWRKRK